MVIGATLPGYRACVPTTIPARDGYELAADVTEVGPTWVIINAAMATKRSFYGPLAAHLNERGFSTVTWDYRGIGESAPASLRGFEASVSDWVFHDMAGVVDWAADRAGHVALIGHSIGGQVVGLLDNAARMAGLVTVAAQSGHWRRQGDGQRLPVLLHSYITLPVLAHALGYAPWSKFAAGEDLPKGAALEWARWCRDRKYVLGDDRLPLERYAAFQAPVLAYAMTDDTWGTPASVDAMMSAYPNLERRDRSPADLGMDRIGHVGAFRPEAVTLWDEIADWIEQVAR